MLQTSTTDELAGFRNRKLCKAPLAFVGELCSSDQARARFNDHFVHLLRYRLLLQKLVWGCSHGMRALVFRDSGLGALGHTISRLGMLCVLYI